MIGKRFYKILKEINSSQSKKLLYFNKSTNDKRLNILSKLIRKRDNSYEEFIVILNKEAKLVFPNQNKTEFNHTLRRLVDFFCSEIENIIIIESTEFDTKSRAKILSDYFIKTANPFLIEYYLNKCYDTSLKQKDDLSTLNVLSKLIPFHYSLYTKKDFITGLKLNEINKDISENYYINKKIEYYNNLSNVYMENNTLIKTTASQTKADMEKLILSCKNPIHIIDLRISQMRLSFGEIDFDRYSKEVELEFKKVPDSESVKIALIKKFNYMKLIYGFFTGDNINDLLNRIDIILQINEKTNHFDSVAIWYKGILLLMKNDFENAKTLLNKSNYFKMDYAYLKEFLLGLHYFIKGEPKKALSLLNNLLDSKNYFIGQFSRLALISIHFKKGNNELCLSLIQSGLRQIKKHPEKFVINSSCLQTLNYFKGIITNKSVKKINYKENKICLFHH